MHEINVHTIADFQRYVQSYGLPKLSIRGLGEIYKRALVALPGKNSLPSRTTGKQEIRITRGMEIGG